MAVISILISSWVCKCFSECGNTHSWLVHTVMLLLVCRRRRLERMVKDQFSTRNRKMQKGLKCETNSAFLYSLLGLHWRKTNYWIWFSQGDVTYTWWSCTDKIWIVLWLCKHVTKKRLDFDLCIRWSDLQP